MNDLTESRTVGSIFVPLLDGMGSTPQCGTNTTVWASVFTPLIRTKLVCSRGYINGQDVRNQRRRAVIAVVIIMTMIICAMVTLGM